MSASAFKGHAVDMTSIFGPFYHLPIEGYLLVELNAARLFDKRKSTFLPKSRVKVEFEKR